MPATASAEDVRAALDDLRATAADLEQMRRRIDAAALLFKVRVMSDELRKREQAPGSPAPRTSTRKTS